ncbi:MAG TPA: DUF5060 domain-containing protein [Candidatus Sumerlaeota bacterium]|nr:DUF5060 domain-containing protein [Candidatus Sumerlaeota bacterium]
MMPVDLGTTVAEVAWVAPSPRLEWGFELHDVDGNPFEAEIDGWIERPDGERFAAPAFFDGDAVWRIRFTPEQSGVYRLAGVTRRTSSGRHELEAALQTPAAYGVRQAPAPGFVRRLASDPSRFGLDGTRPWYPFGMNVAWHAEDQFPLCFARMSEAGMNWSRVWMVHWAGLNLDWFMRGDKLGQLDLEVARRWDRIIESAEQHNIRFQLVLQHHGQVSTFVNSNWHDHPWSRARGGFLAHPAEFFTHPRALELTRRKYRYIVARWGYSPAVMAWELFNEVEYTNGYLGAKVKRWIDHFVDLGQHFAGADGHAVAEWHAEMAALLRSVDVHRHLVTTSAAEPEHPLWESMDYLQGHCYRHDMLGAVSAIPDGADPERPFFWGEIGDHNMAYPDKADGRYTRAMLWAGLMSGAAGAAQIWAWDRVEALDLYRDFAAAAAFIRAGDFAGRRLTRQPVQVEPAPGADATAGPFAMAVADDERVAGWAYHGLGVHHPGEEAVRGRLTLRGRRAGRWRVDWLSTGEPAVLDGCELEVGPEGALVLETPDIRRDVAFVARWLEER